MKDDFDSKFSFVQNGIYVYDFSEGVNKYINKPYTDMLGYTLDDLNNMSPEAFIDLFHPDDRKAITNHISGLAKLKKGEVSSIEYRFKTKNKDWLWCLSQDAGYEYDVEGNLLTFVGSVINITEKKQTENALKEITKSYKELVANSPFGMHFYTLNNENQLIFESANPAANNLLGIDNSQFIGKAIEEAFPPLIDTEVPERYRIAAAQGIQWTTEDVRYEDEKIIGAYKVTAFQTKPGSMVAVFEDITEQKVSESAIKKSEELYRLLADTSTDMIARHDEAGVFLYVSPSCKTLLGYDPEDLLGQSAFDYIHPDDLIRIERNRQKIIQQPINSTITFRFRKKNGKYTWFESNTHTVFDKKTGAVNELHASSRDVSRRVEAEQLIQQQNQLLKELNASKDKFFSILSHDLRSPLSAMCSLLDLLHENIFDYTIEEIGKDLSTIANTANNLASLVDDILMWASSQSGRIPFNPEEIYFNKIAQDTIEIVKASATAKNIAINIIDPGNIRLFADVNMLKTILRNLISNAIKFTNKGGNIDIKVQQNEKTTKIAVIDNGIGMTQAVKEKLFDITESKSIPGTEDEVGTGIGLVLCKEFIDKHRGSIWVESDKGKGSTFSFEIPFISKNEN